MNIIMHKSHAPSPFRHATRQGVQSPTPTPTCVPNQKARGARVGWPPIARPNAQFTVHICSTEYSSGSLRSRCRIRRGVWRRWWSPADATRRTRWWWPRRLQRGATCLPIWSAATSTPGRFWTVHSAQRSHETPSVMSHLISRSISSRRAPPS